MLKEEGRNKERDLRVRTKMFALEIIRLFSELKLSNVAAQTLGKQVLRSGTSIGANYREAFRARSKADFIAKAGICLGEAEETAYWLELLGDSKLVATERVAELQDECSQLVAIFVTILNKAKNGKG